MLFKSGIVKIDLTFSSHINLLTTALVHRSGRMHTTTVTRAQIGRRTPLETVPPGCGQLFLVGHSPPGLLSPPSEREPLSWCWESILCRRLTGALGTDSRAHGAAVPSGSHPHPPPLTSRFPARRAHPRCPAALPTHARALSIVSLLSSPLLSTPTSSTGL